MRYEVFTAFTPVDEILNDDHFDESYEAVPALLSTSEHVYEILKSDDLMKAN